MREVCADFLEREMREDFTKNQVPELSQEGGVGVEGSRGPSGRGQQEKACPPPGVARVQARRKKGDRSSSVET